MIQIQTTYRAYAARKRYRQIRRTVQELQNFARRFLARRRAENLRRSRSILLFQSLWRRQRASRRFEQIRQTLLQLQSCFPLMRDRNSLFA